MTSDITAITGLVVALGGLATAVLAIINAIKANKKASLVQTTVKEEQGHSQKQDEALADLQHKVNGGT